MQASSVEQLCFGRGPNQLNLDAVLQRVEDLIRVIHVLIVELDSRATHWTGMLDKMNVINMNYMQLMSELRPILRQYVIYPKHTDQQSIEDSIPSWLASRLHEEQIQQEQQWRDEMPGGVLQLLEQPGSSLETAEEQVSGLQNLVGWLTNISQTLKGPEVLLKQAAELQWESGVLDPKGKLRQEIDQMSRKIKAAADAADAARQQAGAVAAGPTATSVVLVGQKRGRTGQAATAEAAAALTMRTEEDMLIAKIFTGELFAEREKQPQPQQQQAR